MQQGGMRCVFQSYYHPEKFSSIDDCNGLKTITDIYKG